MSCQSAEVLLYEDVPCVKPALCVNTEVSSPVGEVTGEGEWLTDEGVLQVCLNNSEALKSLPLALGYLDECNELVSLINRYPALFSDTPSQTHFIEHDRCW